jgi:hypothetical protein
MATGNEESVDEFKNETTSTVCDSNFQNGNEIIHPQNVKKSKLQVLCGQTSSIEREQIDSVEPIDNDYKIESIISSSRERVENKNEEEEEEEFNTKVSVNKLKAFYMANIAEENIENGVYFKLNEEETSQNKTNPNLITIQEDNNKNNYNKINFNPKSQILCHASSSSSSSSKEENKENEFYLIEKCIDNDIDNNEIIEICQAIRKEEESNPLKRLPIVNSKQLLYEQCNKMNIDDDYTLELNLLTEKSEPSEQLEQLDRNSKTIIMNCYCEKRVPLEMFELAPSNSENSQNHQLVSSIQENKINEIIQVQTLELLNCPFNDISTIESCTSNDINEKETPKTYTIDPINDNLIENEQNSTSNELVKVNRFEILNCAINNYYNEHSDSSGIIEPSDKSTNELEPLINIESNDEIINEINVNQTNVLNCPINSVSTIENLQSDDIIVDEVPQYHKIDSFNQIEEEDEGEDEDSLIKVNRSKVLNSANIFESSFSTDSVDFIVKDHSPILQKGKLKFNLTKKISIFKLIIYFKKKNVKLML